MKSLIDKVQALETEAQKIVASAQAAGSEQVALICNQEERVIKDVHEQAHKRGKAIKKEKMDATKKELNALHQEEVRALDAVHQAAEANRDQAVSLVLDLLTKELTNKNSPKSIF